MKVIFHTKNIVITEEQKDLMNKKLMRLKRYLKDEPMIIDVYIQDETNENKGGIDQAVELSCVFDDEKIFVREIDNHLMRAFAFAYDRFKAEFERFHQERIDRARK